MTRYLVRVDNSEANRGYTPAHKYVVEASSKKAAAIKVLVKEYSEEASDLRDSLEDDDGDGFRLDGFGLIEVDVYGAPKRHKRSRNDGFGGVF